MTGSVAKRSQKEKIHSNIHKHQTTVSNYYPLQKRSRKKKTQPNTNKHQMTGSVTKEIMKEKFQEK